MPTGEAWFSRYCAGERDAVWRELQEVGAGVRSPETLAAAQSVCDEMAKRARQNIEVIIERLREDGFAFHENDAAKTPTTPHVPPGGRVDEVVGWLTQRFGVVPMTLVSWLHHVGDVWLVGTHPDWPESSSADPLVVELEGSRYPGASMIDYFTEALDAHEEETAEGSTDLFALPVAPDRLHKANVSGGPPYGFIVPSADADATFAAETTLSFVSYLRWVFARGGFPVRTGSTPGERRATHLLAADLLPL